MVRAVADILCPPTLDVLSDLGTTSPDLYDVDATLASARMSLGEDIVYNQAIFDSMNCEEFTPACYEKNDAALRSEVSLDTILATAIAPYLCKAGTMNELRERFKGLQGSFSAIDVLSHGARDCMVQGFEPKQWR